MALTGLEKMLPSTSSVFAFLSGKWEHCKGYLFGNKEYELATMTVAGARIVSSCLSRLRRLRQQQHWQGGK
jgi:hypothetical protein